MYAAGLVTTGVSLNCTLNYVLPFNFEGPNISTAMLSSSTSTMAADGVLTDYVLNSATDTLQSVLKGQRARDQGSQVDRRRPGVTLEDSPQQVVSKQVKDKVCFGFVMVLIPCFCVFGSVGNALSLRVLVHHRMRNSTNMVLAALAVSDLLFLLHALYFSILRLYTLRNQVAGEAFRSMTFPVIGPYGSVVTARITTGLTTMLSLERLIAVYFPIKTKVMCSKVMTVACISGIYLVTAVAFIPNALKYHSFYVTINNQTLYTMGLTALGKNDYFYSIYGNILNILFRLIPIVILILVNIFIALAIRKTWSFRRSMSNGGCTSYEQNRITLMLLMVSLVFLVCILPGAIHSIIDQIYKEYSRSGRQSNIYDVIRNVTYFLETVNSSVNFVIYMAFSTKFCRTYKQIFCCMEQNKIPQSTARSVIRFSSRPQARSGSSSASYLELHFLNQLSSRKVFTVRDADAKRRAVNENGSSPSSGARREDGGRTVFVSKCSVSDSFSSNQSHNNGGNSCSSVSHSSGHGCSRSHNSCEHCCGHSHHNSGHSRKNSGHGCSRDQGSSGHSCGHSHHSGGHGCSRSNNTSGHGCSRSHSGHSCKEEQVSEYSAHSRESQEATAADMFS